MISNLRDERELALELFEISQILGMRGLFDEGKITREHMLMRFEQIHQQTLQAQSRLGE